MTQTYPLWWIAEGLTYGFVHIILWPLFMGYYCSWRIYRLSQEWKVKK